MRQGPRLPPAAGVRAGATEMRQQARRSKMAKLREALIHDLHPTQITVGMIEVHDKKKHLAALSAAEQKAFMQAHPIPAVVGPAGKLFITDHHHLGRAALEAGVTSGFHGGGGPVRPCDRCILGRDEQEPLGPSARPERCAPLLRADPVSPQQAGRRSLPLPGGLCARRRRLREDADGIRGVRLGGLSGAPSRWRTSARISSGRCRQGSPWPRAAWPPDCRGARHARQFADLPQVAAAGLAAAGLLQST